jgi:hypothetical protein
MQAQTVYQRRKWTPGSGLSNLRMTFLKNLGTFASPGLWPLCICGAVTIPATLSQIHSGSLQGPVPSLNVRAYVKSCHLRHPALLLESSDR